MFHQYIKKAVQLLKFSARLPAVGRWSLATGTWHLVSCFDSIEPFGPELTADGLVAGRMLAPRYFLLLRSL